jgi:hypothetical protein
MNEVLEMHRIQQLEMEEELRIHQLEKQRVELNYRRRSINFPVTGSEP